MFRPARTTLVRPVLAPLQGSLFGGAAPAVGAVGLAGGDRIDLAGGAWVEVVPGWLLGADTLLAELVEHLTWRQHTVPMYERLVTEPRLTSWWTAADGPEPLAVLATARHALGRRYRRTFTSIGFNLYRDGHDSVAWHGDRLHDRSDALVAILSIGEPRALQLRPAPGCPASAGAAARSFPLGDGTLLVMGGTCQATWQHRVPKSARPTGPRMSITFRHDSAGRRADPEGPAKGVAV